MITTTTPTPSLKAIDDAGTTLRSMRHSVERDDRYKDAAMHRDLTAAIDVLMRYRLKVEKIAREGIVI